jgi:hypothetical protein
MDIKPDIIRIVADCDLRNHFLRQFPMLFDSYFLSGKELLSEEEINKRSTFNYFLDGIDFISEQITRV